MTERVEQDVPIRLYRFRGRAGRRWRWGVRLPTTPGGVEAYGATPDEALRALAQGLTNDDLAALLDSAEHRSPAAQDPDTEEK